MVTCETGLVLTLGRAGCRRLPPPGQGEIHDFLLSVTTLRRCCCLGCPGRLRALAACWGSCQLCGSQSRPQNGWLINDCSVWSMRSTQGGSEQGQGSRARWALTDEREGWVGWAEDSACERAELTAKEGGKPMAVSKKHRQVWPVLGRNASDCKHPVSSGLSRKAIQCLCNRKSGRFQVSVLVPQIIQATKDLGSRPSLSSEDGITLLPSYLPLVHICALRQEERGAGHEHGGANCICIFPFY